MADPQSAEKLGGVLTAALYQVVWDNPNWTIRTEVYEIEDADDDEDAPLVLVRQSDGARFQIEIEATAWPLPPKEASHAD